MGQKTPKPLLPLGTHGLPSNTPIRWPSPLTTSNGISILNRLTLSHNYAAKSPLVTMGRYAKNLPANCPFPFDNVHTDLIHQSLDQPHSPCQTAPDQNHPFCLSTPSGQIDRLNNWTTDRQMGFMTSTTFTIELLCTSLKNTQHDHKTTIHLACVACLPRTRYVLPVLTYFLLIYSLKWSFEQSYQQHLLDRFSANFHYMVGIWS